MNDLILFVAATAVGTLIAGLVLEHFGRLRNVLEIPVLVAHGTRVVSSAMWQRLLALRYLRLRIDRPASDDATGEPCRIYPNSFKTVFFGGSRAKAWTSL